jgi:hypothetical protein
MVLPKVSCSSPYLSDQELVASSARRPDLVAASDLAPQAGASDEDVMIFDAYKAESLGIPLSGT